MPEVTCGGLPASWLNAWLAAVGTTALDPRIRLSWTSADTPVAVLSCGDLDPVEALVESWPDKTFLHDLPIAETWGNVGELRRRVSVEQFTARASSARGHSHSWTLSSTMTDLSVDENGEVAHAPFDPAGPGTTKWLHHRLVKVHRHIGATNQRLRNSLLGQADRVRDNGLGFDCTRLGSLADNTDPWVEPVVEVLAFFGLALFPMRGQGVDRRLARGRSCGGRQRGWKAVPGTDETRRFMWPAWKQPLDVAGIDALLDCWNPWRQQTWRLFGVHAAWKSVRFRQRATADATRAIGAESM